MKRSYYIAAVSEIIIVRLTKGSRARYRIPAEWEIVEERVCEPSKTEVQEKWANYTGDIGGWSCLFGLVLWLPLSCVAAYSLTHWVGHLAAVVFAMMGSVLFYRSARWLLNKKGPHFKFFQYEFYGPFVHKLYKELNLVKGIEFNRYASSKLQIGEKCIFTLENSKRAPEGSYKLEAMGGDWAPANWPIANEMIFRENSGNHP